MNIIRKIANWIRDGWAIVGITLLLFCFIEGGLTLIFRLNDLRRPPARNFRAEADTYPDRAWAESYYREVDEVEKGGTIRWAPYSYWRRAEYRGKHITIGPDGLRRTHAGAGSGPKVFMFGGSTLWGLGADDETTIPSIFARESDAGQVVNFGQYAYVSTQGVIELMRQLQKGNIPDAVIFYDGVNDTFGAFQLRVAGLAHSEFDRERLFNSSEKSKLSALAAQSVIRDLSVVRLLRGIVSRMGTKTGTLPSVRLQFDPPALDNRALARSVVDAYFNNMKMVQALSKSYGFKFICYWQPVIYTKKNLTEYERKSLDLDFNYPGMKEFYLEVFSLMKQRGAEVAGQIPFHDISSIFEHVREPIYADFNHMGEKGNSAIARRMVEDYRSLAAPGSAANSITGEVKK